MTNTETALTYDHPRWEEFAQVMWTRPTACDHSRTHTRAALRAVGAAEDASIAWLDHRGGHCDCEVLLNVVASAGEAE
jgi:Protein of unknown function (DUF2695)